MSTGCCAPSGGRGADGRDSRGRPEREETVRGPLSLAGLIPLAGGTYLMGSDSPLAYPADGEGPVREATVAPFSIQAATVTNADFARFVAATGHRTDAERYGWSFVFAGLLPDEFPPTRGAAEAPWWRQVDGATWASPTGPLAPSPADPGHPVVHVSWNDAVAYARWAGGRLPTEAEWEFAARGGLEQRNFPWGDELEPGGEHRMNVWQGAFPAVNTQSDGWYGTAPATAFPPNDFGLYNMTGNVWEWCADWFEPGVSRVTKGGSFLCHASYCRRYRVSARQGLSADSTTGNTGFRCVV